MTRSVFKRLTLMLYIACGFLLLALVAYGTQVGANRAESPSVWAEESTVPNLVATVYLKNRLYDTIFEVFVFSIAAAGVWSYLKNLETTEEIMFISETPALVSGRIAAAFSILIGVYLALTGHLSPGGGFSAGVAGGTGLVLAAITGEFEKIKKYFESMKIDILEKLALLFVPAISVAVLTGHDLPPGHFGELFSGGSIPILNLLIFFKVMVGTWLISYAFIRHRGIL